MKERPVIFNGEMVRAILDGRKTQTRRIIANVAADNCIPLQKQSKTKDGIYTHVMDAPMYGLCPFGQVGDRLWVRETFGDCGSRLVYRSDIEDGAASQVKRWVPSIHMPRDACRILLEITAVRVERLNDISEEDARAEGVKAGVCPGHEHMMHQVAFSELWQSIYGVDSWNANPWVWVIEFKRVEVRDARK